MTMASIWFFTNWNISATNDNQAVAASRVAVGQKMAEFALPNFENKEVTVKSYGKPIVVNFFATWCPPCRQEMPDLELFVKKYKTEVDFYAVNIQESRSAVADFMDKNGYTFKDKILFDETANVARAFRLNAIPTTFITDKNGVIRHIWTGAITLKQLEDFLERLPKN